MAAGDLCTLGDVRQALQVPAADTEQDPMINRLITALSKAITRYCGREFVKPDPDSAATRRFELDVSQPWLDLSPYDARDPVSVRIDPEQAGGGTLLTEHEDYRWWPRPNPDGVFSAIRFVWLPPALRHGGVWRLVDVNSKWGFAAVPDDVKELCVLAVQIWLHQNVSAFSTTFSIDEGRLERPEHLPSAVRAGLASYRRETAI